ncbi:hypothetical protein BTVI_82348 [Pitangus sulphuratus]|nr:hypothetical protein BTVI_82348 [Pitangus sulphuratus]
MERCDEMRCSANGAVRYRWSGAVPMERCGAGGAVRCRWSDAVPMERCGANGAVRNILCQIMYMAKSCRTLRASRGERFTSLEFSPISWGLVQAQDPAAFREQSKKWQPARYKECTESIPMPVKTVSTTYKNQWLVEKLQNHRNRKMVWVGRGLKDHLVPNTPAMCRDIFH